MSGGSAHGHFAVAELPVLFAQVALPADEASLWWSVLRTLLSLLGVCALAFVVLTWLARRGIGVGAAGAAKARVRVLERVSLGAHKQLFLVRADQRVLLIGAGSSGAPALIAELESAAGMPSEAVTGAPKPPDELPELPEA